MIHLLPFPSCIRCVHLRNHGCASFPDGIPLDIMNGLHLHKTPHEGEKDGIRFTPRPDAKYEGERETYSGVLPPTLDLGTPPDRRPGSLPSSTRSAILPPMTNGTDRTRQDTDRMYRQARRRRSRATSRT